MPFYSVTFTWNTDDDGSAPPPGSGSTRPRSELTDGGTPATTTQTTPLLELPEITGQAVVQRISSDPQEVARLIGAKRLDLNDIFEMMEAQPGTVFRAKWADFGPRMRSEDIAESLKHTGFISLDNYKGTYPDPGLLNEIQTIRAGLDSQRNSEVFCAVSHLWINRRSNITHSVLFVRHPAGCDVHVLYQASLETGVGLDTNAGWSAKVIASLQG